MICVYQGNELIDEVVKPWYIDPWVLIECKNTHDIMAVIK